MNEGKRTDLYCVTTRRNGL